MKNDATAKSRLKHSRVSAGSRHQPPIGHPELANRQPDSSQGHMRTAKLQAQTSIENRETPEPAPTRKGIRDELGAPRPGFENSILNRFSAYFKAITCRIMTVFKPIVGLVPLRFGVRNYRTRHPLCRAPNQDPPPTCENQPGKASVCGCSPNTWGFRRQPSPWSSTGLRLQNPFPSAPRT